MTAFWATVITTVVIGLISLVVVYVIFTSIYVIPADKMLASFFMRGTYEGVYVSGTYLRNLEEGEPLPKDAKRAHLLSNIVILLWPFWTGIYFPRTNVVLRYHSSRIYTRDGIPVVMDATMVFELDAYLADFIEEFNVIGKGSDMARDQKIKYEYDHDPIHDEPTFREYNGPCLAQIVLNDTTDLLHETLRRVAEEYQWDDLRSDIEGFEAKVRRRLAAPESRFAKAGMLTLENEPDLFGLTVRDDGIDINFEDVVPVDKKFFDSLSAPGTAQKNAEARKFEGIGEGDRIKETAERAGMTGEELVRNETVREAEELNIIAAKDSLSAIVGGLIAGRNTPRTGARGQRNDQDQNQQDQGDTE